MEEKEANKKRLVVDIPIEQHIEIKKRAATRGITMKVWVLRAIRKAIDQEDRFK